MCAWTPTRESTALGDGVVLDACGALRPKALLATLLPIAPVIGKVLTLGTQAALAPSYAFTRRTDDRVIPVLGGPIAAASMPP